MVDPYIGKILDNRYEILERIGTGGMAVVYKAKCHRLNRLVAVKILKSDLAQDEDFRRRFHAESNAVAMLSHPNIVSVYDVSQSNDVEYIVMELIDGITLKQYMEKRGHLDWRESLHFITQIMHGLSHAHSRGIVHRDIKPQNIMVLRDGSVRVADFGIACLENSSQTLTQEALGSVHYISPEQARGDRTDARSDIYSAGVVLYEMLTNRLPFEGDSAVSVAIQHLSSIPLAPREINKDIPDPLELICMKAMAPDRDRRYDSADAMIADLDSFRKNPGVNLDINLDDLHPEEPDEPTRLIHTGSVPAAHHSGRVSVRERDINRNYDRNYDRDYDRSRSGNAPRGSNGKRIAMISSVSVVAVIAIFFLVRAVVSSLGGPDSYTVPGVVGSTVEDARKMEGVAGIFEITVTDTKYDDNIPADKIIEQDPAEGMPVKSDLVIKVVVSAGVQTEQMPDLTGKEAQAAKLELKKLKDDLGLTILPPEEEFNDDVTAGCIIRTEPEAGEHLKKGDEVTLFVSKGPEAKPVTVPSVLTLSIEKAKKQLVEDLGLVVNVTEVESSEPVGIVVGQNIPGGTQMNQGDTIILSVSKGPASKPSEGSTSETFALPQDGRESVYVIVMQDGKTLQEGWKNCADGSIAVELTGSGTSTVQVYYDGELFDTRTVDFNG